MVVNSFCFPWEVKLIEACQTYLPSFLISLLSFVSNVGDTIFVVLIVAFIYLCYKKQIGRSVIASTIISLLVAGQLKNIFLRSRPYFDHKSIKCFKIIDKNYDLYDIKGQGYSFPSMHSSNITVITGTIHYYLKTKGTLIFAICASLIVGISRFVLGCHYPTDVLAGWILGLLTVKFVPKFLDNTPEKKVYIVEIILGLIGCFFCKTDDYYSTFGLLLGFICADIFENKYVKFENTKNIIKIVLRLVVALGAFVIVDNICKIPFSYEVLENSGYISYTLRTIRYAIAAFVSFGITPMLYKHNYLKLDDNKIK